MRRALAAVVFSALPAALLGPGALRAQDGIEVDMELVLAVDVSRSMTRNELDIQRRGYAEALVSPEVMGAILDGPLGRIAVTYVEWAGADAQRVVVDWTMIETPADAAEIARILRETPFSTARRTSISGALTFSGALFEDNGFTSWRHVIDVSGDGPNNSGAPVTAARDSVLAQGITINGLPLMTREGTGRWHLEDLDRYYANCVIGGPGAFVIPVTEWTGFAEAVRRKLVLEIASDRAEDAWASLFVPVQDSGYDCLVGERRWEQDRIDWDFR